MRHLVSWFRSPAMVGVPPSAQPAWNDPAAHARDFGRRYCQDVDLTVAQRMRELGIPDQQIGMPDPIDGVDWAAFPPHGMEGEITLPTAG
jgi:hypothetical protein